MTPEQQQASFLIQTLGRERAIDHVLFVLKNLVVKEATHQYWKGVLKMIYEI
jgi:hypothetical protein